MEQFLHDNQLYIVLILVLTIWFGFLFYMFRLDSKIKKLEESLRK
ncbi:MAG: CcmD family protein [Ignavibacteriales bacterium]|nr:CcmD family protein [Ignavibacteriales bacterium]